MESHRERSQQSGRARLLTHMRHLLTILLLSAIWYNSAAQLRGRVINVHDGDTFTMLMADGSTRIIRLQGIDCPEMGQPYGPQSRYRANQLIYNKDILVDSITRDRYHRTIGIAYTPAGDTLNILLLREGLAWHYTKYDTSAYADTLEATARSGKIGLWALPIPPWQWRRMGRGY